MQSNTKRHPAPHPSCTVVPEKNLRRPARERILLEFPATLLRRADQAAAELDASRSELVRTALERLLNDMEKKKLESELAEAYTANSAMNLELARDFKHVDQEGF